MLTALLSNTAALNAIILLLPLIAIGLAVLVKRPTYFEATGMMLGILLNIPYLFLLNIIATHIGWWNYYPTENSYYNVPVEIVLGWSIFWGGLLPYISRNLNMFLVVSFALILDVACMPLLKSLFFLGDYWLLGELVVLLICLMPSLLIFKLTVERTNVFIRACIQSFIWGGWMVFLIPSIALFAEGKDIFDIFNMESARVVLFMTRLDKHLYAHIYIYIEDYPVLS